MSSWCPLRSTRSTVMPAQVIQSVGDVQHQQPAAAQQPLVVLPQAEDVHGALFLVPIAPNPFEDTGTVMEGVGHYVDPGRRPAGLLLP